MRGRQQQGTYSDLQQCTKPGELECVALRSVFRYRLMDGCTREACLMMYFAMSRASTREPPGAVCRS